MTWITALTGLVTPLTKYVVETVVKRRDKRKADEAARLAEEEKQRLKTQTFMAIRDAKENWKDNDPSKYVVNKKEEE